MTARRISLRALPPLLTPRNSRDLDFHGIGLPDPVRSVIVGLIMERAKRRPVPPVSLSPDDDPDEGSESVGLAPVQS